jgi:hypothetical protein
MTTPPRRKPLFFQRRFRSCTGYARCRRNYRTTAASAVHEVQPCARETAAFSPGIARIFCGLSEKDQQQASDCYQFATIRLQPENAGLCLERLSKPGMASQMVFVFEHRSGAAVWGP